MVVSQPLSYTRQLRVHQAVSNARQRSLCVTMSVLQPPIRRSQATSAQPLSMRCTQDGAQGRANNAGLRPYVALRIPVHRALPPRFASVPSMEGVCAPVRCYTSVPLLHVCAAGADCGTGCAHVSADRGSTETMPVSTIRYTHRYTFHGTGTSE